MSSGLKPSISIGQYEMFDLPMAVDESPFEPPKIEDPPQEEWGIQGVEGGL
jgi:hypothetical protein